MLKLPENTYLKNSGVQLVNPNGPYFFWILLFGTLCISFGSAETTKSADAPARGADRL